MSTTLSYGGIEIRNCRTIDFEQSSVKDETQTDIIGTKVRIRVQGYIHLRALDIHGFSTAPNKGTVAEAYKPIKNAMMRQRQFLQYNIEGTPLVSAKAYSGAGSPANASDDIGNGPTPLQFTVTKVIGNKVLECEFEVEALLSGTDSSLTVLSNRFSVMDIIDENFFVTRQWRGKLRTVAPNSHVLGVHGFRGLVIPPLNKGFKRQRVEATSSTSGLELDYVIVDVQTKDAPPYPATSWSGEHVVQVSGMGGDMSGMGTSYSLSVQLSGPPDVRKADLLALAAAIGRDRIGYQSAGDRAVVLQDYSLTDILGSNSVRMSVKVFSPGMVTDVGEIDTSKIGTPLGLSGYDERQGQAPADFGYATTAGLFVSLLQSPATMQNPGSGSFAISYSNQGGIDPTTTAAENPNNNVAQYTSPNLPPFVPQTSPYDSAHTENPYVFYQIESKTHCDLLRVVCPIAKRSSGSSGSTGSSQDTVVVIPVGQGVSKRTFTVDAERVGAVPSMPEPKDTFTDDNGIKFTLLDMVMLSPQSPEFTADGVKKVLRLKVQYIYAMSRPLKSSEKLDLGCLPWDTSTFSNNVVDMSVSFKGGITYKP